MDLAAMLAAILKTVLDLKIFLDLLSLKNKVVLTKYELTYLLNCGCLSQFGVK